jgi:O-acetyl-ADP-ribose deacetylase (regulator of RNase III)
MEEPGMKIGVENVRRATRAALVAAAFHKIETIALPVMGSGSGGVPVDEAARAMVDELRAHKHPSPGTVYLVATNEISISAFEAALKNASAPG